jgi:hypothetical protein
MLRGVVVVTLTVDLNTPSTRSLFALGKKSFDWLITAVLFEQTCIWLFA